MENENGELGGRAIRGRDEARVEEVDGDGKDREYPGQGDRGIKPSGHGLVGSRGRRDRHQPGERGE